MQYVQSTQEQLWRISLCKPCFIIRVEGVDTNSKNYQFLFNMTRWFLHQLQNYHFSCGALSSLPRPNIKDTTVCIKTTVILDKTCMSTRVVLILGKTVADRIPLKNWYKISTGHNKAKLSITPLFLQQNTLKAIQKNHLASLEKDNLLWMH